MTNHDRPPVTVTTKLFLLHNVPQLSQPFDNWFRRSSNFHTHNARWSNLGCLNVPSHRAKLYGRNFVCISATFTRNYLQNLHINILFHNLTTTCLKKLLTLHFFKKICLTWLLTQCIFFYSYCLKDYRLFVQLKMAWNFSFWVSLWHMVIVWWKGFTTEKCGNENVYIGFQLGWTLEQKI